MSLISFREISLVDYTISKEYECPVCFEILRAPFLTECCGNHFCEACIDATRISTGHCPICKAKPIKGIVDKKLQRRINDLKVYCSQKKHGCTWVGRLDELTKHLETDSVKGCKYALVSCSLSCGKQLFRCKLSDHLSNECQLRPYTCKFCNYSSTYEDVTKHFSSCLEYPLVCPNSCTQEEFKRLNLDQHLLVCPNEIVLCAFSEMGCTESMKRCLLRKHMEKSWMQHQLMICDAFKQLKKENEILKKETDIRKKENEILKRENEEMKKTQKTVDYWINGYKMMAEEVMKTNWREYLCSLAVVSTNIPEPICPVILKWTGYEALKSKTKEGEYCYMRPFYTHSGGYKMQLRIYPNGLAGEGSTHISLYCHLVSGKNDDNLTWPFKGSVVVTLLNQLNDSEHFNKELWSTSHIVPNEAAKKPDGVRNDLGWGSSQFISTSEAEDSTGTKQYLANDTLVFKIYVSV